MKILKDMILWVSRGFGFRISRLPANRFQAMEDSLRLLRRIGCRPTVVIDGGANVGVWTRSARRIFPASRFHLIEPQPRCVSLLNKLSPTAASELTVHPFAITSPGIGKVHIIGGGECGTSSGAWVQEGDENAEGNVECLAITLDELFHNLIRPDDRILLKLDLEGHELKALYGASVLLHHIDVIVCEVQFYRPNDDGRPLFGDLVSYLRERGFEVFDIASLSASPRFGRLHVGDAIFVNRHSSLASQNQLTQNEGV
jgi:FkbM family methyltransferase